MANQQKHCRPRPWPGYRTAPGFCAVPADVVDVTRSEVSSTLANAGSALPTRKRRRTTTKQPPISLVVSDIGTRQGEDTRERDSARDFAMSPPLPPPRSTRPRREATRYKIMPNSGSESEDEQSPQNPQMSESDPDDGEFDGTALVQDSQDDDDEDEDEIEDDESTSTPPPKRLRHMASAGCGYTSVPASKQTSSTRSHPSLDETMMTVLEGRSEMRQLSPLHIRDKNAEARIDTTAPPAPTLDPVTGSNSARNMDSNSRSITTWKAVREAYPDVWDDVPSNALSNPKIAFLAGHPAVDGALAIRSGEKRASLTGWKFKLRSVNPATASRTMVFTRLTAALVQAAGIESE